jgi:transmembrane sensor
MSANDDRVRSLIIQQAADWFVRNREGLTAKERPVFTRWLQASPLHVEEYLAVSVISRDLREACDGLPGSLNELLARARLDEDVPICSPWARVSARRARAGSHPWQTAAVTVTALSVLSWGLLTWFPLRPLPHVSPAAGATELHLKTGHGEQLTRQLADESVLHLNTDTAVTIRYSKNERLVELASGEADFEVAPAPDRAFHVLAGSAEIVAIGTQFNVRLKSNSTLVTVGEGRVAVGLIAMQQRAVIRSGRLLRAVELVADQQINVATQTEWPARPVTVDAARTTAWLHRQIMFDHEPLQRVAVEFNRYASKPIEILSPSLQGLEISGVFATDDIDAFIAFLRSLQGVRVEVTPTQIRVSQT